MRDRAAGALSARRLLLVVIIVAVLLRMASALYQGNVIELLPGIADQRSYHQLAQRVAGGYGFSFAEGHWPATRAGEPTAHWSYAYTLYLAFLYALLGVQPLVARIIQAIVVGVLHTWLAWRIGNRVFGPPVGIIAAGITAVYVYFVYYSAGLLTEAFYIVGIMWALDASLRILERSAQADGDTQPGLVPRRLWLELGLALGLTILLRQVFLLFVPFLFLWLWLNGSTEPLTRVRASLSTRWPALKGLVVAALMILVMVIPWTVRNYYAFGTFVPLNTNAGFAFFWGNHPIHGTNFIPILTYPNPSYYELIPAELLPLNEAQLDQALLRKGVAFVAADPGRYAVLSLSRAQEYFKFWPSSDSGTLSNISRVLSFGLFLPFMLYGIWLSLSALRRSPRLPQRRQILLLYLFVVVYTLIHLLTWTLVRYRLPIDAVLILFAAYASVDLYQRARPHLKHAAALGKTEH